MLTYIGTTCVDVIKENSFHFSLEVKGQVCSLFRIRLICYPFEIIRFGHSN